MLNCIISVCCRVLCPLCSLTLLFPVFTLIYLLLQGHYLSQPYNAWLHRQWCQQFHQIWKWHLRHLWNQLHPHDRPCDAGNQRQGIKTCSTAGPSPLGDHALSPWLPQVDYMKYLPVNLVSSHPHYDQEGNAYNMGTSIAEKGKTKYMLFKVPAATAAKGIWPLFGLWPLSFSSFTLAIFVSSNCFL